MAKVKAAEKKIDCILSEETQREIAREWCEGRLMFSTHVPSALFNMVFMPVMFCDPKQRQDLIDRQTYAFYGKMEDAGPRAINGYPIFNKVGSVNEADFRKIESFAKVYDAFINNFTGTPQ